MILRGEANAFIRMQVGISTVSRPTNEVPAQVAPQTGSQRRMTARQKLVSPTGMQHNSNGQK
jgi:hypothetical protein